MKCGISGISLAAGCKTKSIGEAACSPAAAGFPLVFLGQEDPKVSYSSMFNQGTGGSTLCSSPGRFKICRASAFTLAPLVSLSCVVPSLANGWRVHELCLAQLREQKEFGSYRSVLACFPPRAAEFGLQTSQDLQLPQAGRKKKSNSLTIRHLQLCLLIGELKWSYL